MARLERYLDAAMNNLVWLAISGIITYLVTLRKKTMAENEATRIKVENHDKALQRAVVAMLRTDILTLYEKAVGRGYTTLHERDAMVGLLETYYALGGNGTIHHIESLYKEIRIEIDPNDIKEKAL